MLSTDPRLVFNQPPHLADYNLLQADPVLAQIMDQKEMEFARAELTQLGDQLGTAEFQKLGEQANRFRPELRTHDRFGHRIDEVEFHPAWHTLMATGVKAKVHCWPWLAEPSQPLGVRHQARVAAHYMLSQIEAGVGCPLTMTFAAVPTLRLGNPQLAKVWEPKITSTTYDFGLRHHSHKKGCIVGMAMTEKQGGSDVRANTTLAHPCPSYGEDYYRLEGHKFFCSAPMSDGFLTLAQLPEGLTCFFVARVLDDGARNSIRIQRLKDKLGNHSNASSEIEYHDTLAIRVGPPGRGVNTIIEMVNHTRLDCMISSTALMRSALLQAYHHSKHRSAFGKLLVKQELMRQVLADLSLEWQASFHFLMDLAEGYGRQDAQTAAFVRLATAAGKYWVCKRAPAMVGECLESLGGAGYVEEAILARLYREAPLPSIWEGSGNVMTLDILRALAKSPQTWEVCRQLLHSVPEQPASYHQTLSTLDNLMMAPCESQARLLAEKLALSLQARILLHKDPAVGEQFCQARLAPERGLQYGSTTLDCKLLLSRIAPD